MRINHNIAALNTYRQLNSANGAQSKSMEKLSSGLRINKAGDDAAGLAISEKMRGQIRGLDMASKNAQDGVSMAQTAEGALNETHDILQRMRELAVQASNDTNTADDRGEIQKEVNQLTSEINRIGNTTEFNTQKLINGDKKITSATAPTTNTATAATLASGSDAVAATWNSGAITVLADTESNTFAFGGVTVTLNGADGAPVAAAATNDTTAAVTVDTVTADAEAVANALKAAFESARDYADGDLTDNALAGFTFSVSGTGAAAQLVITDTAANGATNNTNSIVKGGTGSSAIVNDGLDATNVANTDGAAAVAAAGSFTISGAAEGEKLTLGNKSVAFYDSTSGTYASAAEAQSALGVDAMVDINGLTTDAAVADAVRTAIGTLTGNDVDLATTDTAGSATISLAATTAGAAGNSLATTATGVLSSSGGVNLQIGANQSQSLTLDLGDMRAQELGITSLTATTGFTSVNTVSNGTSNATTEKALDVSNATNASAAITKIQSAIDKVSAERSKIGAYTNRLEHTINNLGTSSENLTAAESRVRDVDMAKEMMNQTKNSILSQAAQAMLAQANQQPQGVLQLLR